MNYPPCLNCEHYYTGGLLCKTCDKFDLFKPKSPIKETTNMDKEVLKTVFPDDKLTLEVLAEEASEIIQAKSKIIRFGLNDSFNETIRPDQTNKQKLEAEIFQFLAVVDILIARGVIDPINSEQIKQAKWEKMVKWNAYNGTKGDL